jgi:hypothetical protein
VILLSLLFIFSVRFSVASSLLQLRPWLEGDSRRGFDGPASSSPPQQCILHPYSCILDQVGSMAFYDFLCLELNSILYRV